MIFKSPTTVKWVSPCKKPSRIMQVRFIHLRVSYLHKNKGLQGIMWWVRIWVCHTKTIPIWKLTHMSKINMLGIQQHYWQRMKLKLGISRGRLASSTTPNPTKDHLQNQVHNKKPNPSNFTTKMHLLASRNFIVAVVDRYCSVMLSW